MIVVDLQNASTCLALPTAQQFTLWAKAAMQGDNAEITIRVVDEAESAALNGRYRGKAGPTNVLSFPFQAPPGIKTDILGDLLICAPVVVREAEEQGKSPHAHWAHLVVHGVLHLQGYDHSDEQEAVIMETEEIAIMNGLGFPNPYAEAAA
jgi:probable rRNA maturation factor